jgi:phosphatidylglycerol:prolipoprotein diacylglycerol transferase
MIKIGIDPVAFLNIRWYGIFVALAIIVLILWMVWQVKKGADISYDTITTGALVGIPSGIIVSRLLHVLDRWSFYSQHPAQIIGAAGLTIYGAILGAALALWIYSKFSKFQFGHLADLIAPGLILAQIVGRIGCTINGCCYGTPTSLPWAIVYTNPNSLAPLGVPVHPTTIYEIIFLLILFGGILALRGHLKPDGSLFLVYFGLYSAWRVGSDFLRTGTPFLFGLHQAQVIGIVVIAIAIFLLSYRTRWVRTQKNGGEDEGTGTP